MDVAVILKDNSQYSCKASRNMRWCECYLDRYVAGIS